MRGGCLIAVLICAAQALAWVALPARAEDQATPVLQRLSAPPAPSTVPSSEPPPTAEAAGEAKPRSAVIRAMLADPSLGKGANADDLAAVQAFYAARTAGPLWTTEMGFSAKGQAALFGIGNADDWGLDASAFELPPAGALPAKPEDQAIAEIKLDLAVLKYARFARGGRFNPLELSVLLDQTPHMRDPRCSCRDRRCCSAGSISAVPASEARAIRPPTPGAAQSPRQGGRREAGEPPPATRTSSASS